VADQRERFQSNLHGCAEAGVPETVDLWPGIEEKLSLSPRRSRRFLPRTRTAWGLVALLIVAFSTGAYASSGWVNDLFDYTAPEIMESNFGVPIDQSQTVDGITYTLEKAYADETNVVVGYSIRGFENRPSSEPNTGLPTIKDGSETDFAYVGGLGVGTDPLDRSVDEGELSDLAFFEPSRKLPPSGEHRFRFELKHTPQPKDDSRQNAGSKEPAKTLVFDFEVPVREVQVIEVQETVEAGGLAMTLDRVENSPARTRAFLCFDPPHDDRFNWVPVVERPNIAQSDVFANESLFTTRPDRPTGCVGYDLFRSLYDQPGNHSLTVDRIEGRSEIQEKPDEVINGPWRFEFEVPER
jgi:hypothetical protein